MTDHFRRAVFVDELPKTQPIEIDFENNDVIVGPLLIHESLSEDESIPMVIGVVDKITITAKARIKLEFVTWNGSPVWATSHAARDARLMVAQ